MTTRAPLHPSSTPMPTPAARDTLGLQPAAVLELLKPVTWFPPMWAFGCGVVSTGVAPAGHWPSIILGIVLAGPMVCASSQAVNDWFDRHVDAINEPGRPIPSGRIPGRAGLYIAVLWTALSLALGAVLGATVCAAAVIGLALAWAYSAPPLRLKQNGWWGNAACGLCYEGLAWITGAAVMTGGQLDARTLCLAFLYSLGAHGIMTLNDFKSIEGDLRTGIASLPVQLGVAHAALAACVVMALAQALVIVALLGWQRPIHGGLVALLLAGQLVLMRRFIEKPSERATWYSANGVGLFVLGMLISAFALQGS